MQSLAYLQRPTLTCRASLMLGTGVAPEEAVRGRRGKWYDARGLLWYSLIPALRAADRKTCRPRCEGSGPLVKRRWSPPIFYSHWASSASLDVC